MQLSNALIGIAGVHLVAAELAINGIIGTVTSRNTKGIDLLASRTDGLKNVGIQVKTTKRGQRIWMLNEKAETLHSNDFFYVFVELGKDKSEFYVVPSKIVAKHVKQSHQEWLKRPGRNGQKHKDQPMRNFWIETKEDVAKYRRKWDILALR